MNIGILGGGQLSRMLALAGIPLGLQFFFYEPNETSAVMNLGNIARGSYDDYALLKTFADKVDVITYENENIPVSTLEFLEQHNSVFPGKNALAIMQDRLFEKTLFNDLKIPTNTFFTITNKHELQSAAEKLGYPLLLKQRTQGYDGKGQIKLNSAADIDQLTDQDCQNIIAEEWVPFDREVSLIAARNQAGTIVFYDIAENTHDKGILHKTLNKINDPIAPIAQAYLTRILTHLNYIGVMAIEFFERDGNLVANEMAPRVHNTGHWTIDAAEISQFENHLRAILNWPLGDTSSLFDAVMHNIIGTMPNRQEALAQPNTHLHDYHKSERPGRKIGHITCRNTTQIKDSI